MLARVKDPTTRVIYAATLTVGIAYGVSIALTALRLHALGFGKPAIGSLAAVFASGIVVASVPMAALLKRFSAKTVLVVSLAGYALPLFLMSFFGEKLYEIMKQAPSEVWMALGAGLVTIAVGVFVIRRRRQARDA